MTRSKKRIVKRKRNGKRKASVPRVLGGFPEKKLVRLKYAQEIAITGVAGGIAQHQFRANSAFDPDFAIGGHQPMNFDRWATLYDHYTVMSSTCKITPTTGTNTNQTPGYMGIMVSTDSAGTATLAQVVSLFENKLSSHRYMQVGNSAGVSRGHLSSGVKSNFNAKRLFGIKDPEDGGAYGALVTANPTRDAYYNVYLASINANTPSGISCLVEIEYTVLFDELVTQAQN